MEYVRTYKSFINSQYVYEGLRVTAGILIPALLMAYFDMLSTGIVLSLGAMCVSLTDSAGPIHHRRNGMLACIAFVFVVSIITSVAASSPLIMGIVLFALCFFFSMIGIYGPRAGGVGIAALLILVIEIEQPRQGWEVLNHAFYLLMGGVWYMCFSILLYNVRPYKLAQQALGDCIQSIADYLRYRADFYNRNVDYDAVYRNLLHQQAIVQEKQTSLAELLFKTRNIVQESTPTGRILVMTYLDVADMYERIMTSYQNYITLHQYFDEDRILEHFNALARELADEIENIGIAIKSGTPSNFGVGEQLSRHIADTRKRLDALRETQLTNENISGFMSLRRIIENIEDIAGRVKTLHRYTTYDSTIAERKGATAEFEEYISHQEITPELFLHNLGYQSESFRHSLRLSITVILGYLVSLFFPVGHGYWILLTVVVIIKPAYSLTKSRNKDRLLGTVVGVILGMVLLYLVEDRTALLVIMIVLMVGTYTFLRKHYLSSVIMMTPYIIIFFHLLNANQFRTILADRLIDTAIGSALGFATSLFIFPAWEHEKIKPLMTVMLQEATAYFNSIGAALTGSQAAIAPQLARKNALVALANLSDAFNRMQMEPARMQHSTKEVHQFVVLCHMLVSHIATLALFAQKYTGAYHGESFKKAVQHLPASLEQSVKTLEGAEAEVDNSPVKDILRTLNADVQDLMEQRRTEIETGFGDTETRKRLIEIKSAVDQFNFINNTATDIHKTTRKLVETL